MLVSEQRRSLLRGPVRRGCEVQKETSRRAPAGVAGRPPVDACALLARVAGRLGEAGDAALSDALSLLVDGLELRSAVLRDAVDGEVLAVAGDHVHAVPLARDRVAVPGGVVEVPVQAGAARSPRSPSSAPVPRTSRRCGPSPPCSRSSCAAPPPGCPWRCSPPPTLAADRAADALHDGPVQELVVARYAADAAVRGGDATTVRDAVQSSLVSLRRALWMLRPRPAAGESLAAVLPQLSSRLQEAGRPGLLLDVDADAAARLSGPAAAVCYRLVQEVAGPPAARPRPCSCAPGATASASSSTATRRR
jgi:hypothetical protein